MILAKNVTLHILQISSQFSQGGKKMYYCEKKGEMEDSWPKLFCGD